jgi:outer membrane protein assembly factor BamB
MTSDRNLETSQRRLVEFSERVFQGRPAGRKGLDPAQADAVLQIKAGDRVPLFDKTRVRARKEELMHLVTATAVPGVVPGSGITIPEQNGRIPRPALDIHAPKVSRRRLMQAIPFLVLAGILAGIAYGLFEYRDDRNTIVPAVQETQTSETGAPIGTPWGQFRGGPERTGYTSDPGPGGDLALRWSFTAEESLNGIMQAEGKVFAYGAEGGLYAIDAGTGEQIWALDLFEGQFGDVGRVPLPAISDGVVYAATPQGVLVAVEAETGVLIWQQVLSNRGLSAPTVAEGRVFVALDGARIVALDPASGEEQWAWTVPGGVSTQYPTVYDGKLSIADDEGVVYGVDIATGELVWSTESILAHRVSAFLDGTLYVPGADGRLTALDAATGEIIWVTEPQGAQALNPIATEDAVIVAVEADKVQALNPESGEVLWTISAATVFNSPHAGGDSLYLETDTGIFATIDLASGSETGRTSEATGAGSTVAVSGELLFISGRDGPVRAFGPVDGEAQSNTGTIPALAAIENSSETDASEASTDIDAPGAGELRADLFLTQTHEPDFFAAGFQKAPDGTLWLAEGNGTIQILDRDGNLGETRTYAKGSGDGEFIWEIRYPPPMDIWWQGASFAWLKDGRVEVTDAGNARIQVMDEDGNLVGVWGSRGDADGQFQAPVWIALTPDDELAVVDPGRRDIQWFDLEGNFLRKLTGPQIDEQFGRPVELEYDASGSFWVLDVGYDRLHKFDANGDLLFTIGEVASPAAGSFNDPVDIDIDELDRVWVADQVNHRVQVFDNDGNLIAIWDGCESDAKCFQYLNWVIYGGNDFLFLYDFDINGVEDQRQMKFKITFMPDVPILEAATPAAG